MIIKTITVSGTSSVDFAAIGGSFPSNRFVWIKNKSDAVMYASATNDVGSGVNGTTEIASGESGLVMMSQSSTIYISGNGKAEIKASDFAECPFKKPQKGGDVLPKYAGGYSGFIDINRNNSEDMYSRLNSLPFITNTGEDLSLEFCMKILSGRTHAGRYLDFDNGTFVIADEYSDGHYYLEIKCGGEWRLTESSQIEIPQDMNFTLSVVIGAENTQIFIHKENGDSNFYTYNSLDSSMLDDLTSGDTYFFDSTESNRHVDGKLYAFRKYRRALTMQEITANHLEDMRLVAMANRLEIIKQPESKSVPVGARVNATVEAIGEGLTYQWEYKYAESYMPGAQWTTFKNYDSIPILNRVMKDYWDNMKIRVIITDCNNNSVTSDEATLTVAEGQKNIDNTSDYEDYSDLKSDNDEYTKVKEIDDLWK